MSHKEDPTFEACPNEPEAPWFQVPRSFARDPNISLACKGFLTYLMSHTSNFKLSMPWVMKTQKIKKFTLYKLVNEAMKAGYLKRDTYLVKGWKRYRYLVSATGRFKNSLHCAEKQDTVGQDTAEQHSELEQSPPEKKLEQSSSKKKKAPAATAIVLNQETKKFEGIAEEDIKRWQITFPAINVRKELQEALLWALNTPRKNYRRSLDVWMANVNKSNTTPFKRELEASEPATQEDFEANKKMGDALEAQFFRNPTPNYGLNSCPTKIVFILPENEGYSVDYAIKKQEFLRLCQKALKKMKIAIPTY